MRFYSSPDSRKDEMVDTVRPGAPFGYGSYVLLMDPLTDISYVPPSSSGQVTLSEV